jgi:D-alanyl-lipoteichoic acid acyltransferase DltB (MBOAT superfamily)
LFSIGFTKKVLVADNLAKDCVNPLFSDALERTLSFAEAWNATLGFALQIFLDFSAYTEMAIGIALLFGLLLPDNFRRPYLATDLRDFWRRWHITLSTFIRDYLYIPLGGSRNGLAVQVAALFTTMTLGGLWHGAGLTFVAWGVAHGLGLGAGVLWRRAGLAMPNAVGWALTFVFVMLAWVLFRATSFDAALRIYEGLFGLTTLGSGFKWRAITAAAAIAILGPTAWTLVHKLPPYRWIAVAFAILFVITLFNIGDDANYEFIYFQF